MNTRTPLTAALVWTVLAGSPAQAQEPINIGVGLGGTSFVEGYPVPVVTCIENTGPSDLQLPVYLGGAWANVELSRDGETLSKHLPWVLEADAIPSPTLVTEAFVLKAGRTRAIGFVLPMIYHVDVPGTYTLRVGLSIPSSTMYPTGPGLPPGWTGTVWSDDVTFTVQAATGNDVAVLASLRRNGELEHVPAMAFRVGHGQVTLVGTSFADCPPVMMLLGADQVGGSGTYNLGVGLAQAAEPRHQAALAAVLASHLLIPDPDDPEEVPGEDAARAASILLAAPEGALSPCDPIAKIKAGLGL